MDRETAQKVVTLLLESSGKIDESAALVKEKCSDAEFKEYRRVCGQIMGDMLTEMLLPIFREYPDLQPW